MISELHKHTILIVEDEASLRHALRDKFTREGYIVLDAKDGELGLALAIKEEPELILLDMMMPKMDGMTMLTALRLTGSWGNTVPVLLLTNLGSDDKLAMKEITEDPRAQYLVKSNWPLGKLVEKVRETVTLQGVYNY